jgi:hypothetical protein
MWGLGETFVAAELELALLQYLETVKFLFVQARDTTCASADSQLLRPESDGPA